MANLDLFRSRDTEDMPPLTPGQRSSKRARYHHTKEASAPEASTNGAGSSSISIAKELADAKRMVQAFDAIDSSITEAREKLKIFYKTADETNTLLDMWIRLLSQTEHTLNLLQDSDWEGKTMEEIQAQEAMEKRSAIEEAIRRETMSNRALLQSNPLASAGATKAHGEPLALSNIPSSRSGNHSVSQPFTTTTTATADHRTATGGSLRRSQLASSLSKKPSTSTSSAAAILAAAHAHASAVEANRRRQDGAGLSTTNLNRPGGVNSVTSVRSSYPYSSSSSR